MSYKVKRLFEAPSFRLKKKYLRSLCKPENIIFLVIQRILYVNKTIHAITEKQLAFHTVPMHVCVRGQRLRLTLRRAI